MNRDFLSGEHKVWHIPDQTDSYLSMQVWSQRLRSTISTFSHNAAAVVRLFCGAFAKAMPDKHFRPKRATACAYDTVVIIHCASCRVLGSTVAARQQHGIFRTAPARTSRLTPSISRSIANGLRIWSSTPSISAYLPPKSPLVIRVWCFSPASSSLSTAKGLMRLASGCATRAFEILSCT